MQLKSMFEKQIDRDIKGVIKVGQSDEENIYQELDEYVVTKELLKHFRDFFENYDVILTDTPPNMSCINQNIFYIADDIILISDISMNGFRGTQLFQTLWTSMCQQLEKPYNVSGFLINRFDKRVGLSNDYIEFCKNNDEVKDYLFNTIIPENVELKKAEINGLPINIFNTKCAGYDAYKNLFLELIERGIV
jgi:chromosome partitioning protein